MWKDQQHLDIIPESSSFKMMLLRVLPSLFSFSGYPSSKCLPLDHLLQVFFSPFSPLAPLFFLPFLCSASLICYSSQTLLRNPPLACSPSQRKKKKYLPTTACNQPPFALLSPFQATGPISPPHTAHSRVNEEARKKKKIK